MKIYLYLSDKIEVYFLPKDISGSYSFDFDENEGSKLININAVDHKWILYSTEDSTIISNNAIVREVELVPNSFYFLRRNNQSFIIYTTNTNEDFSGTYLYNENININTLKDDKSKNKNKNKTDILTLKDQKGNNQIVEEDANSKEAVLN